MTIFQKITALMSMLCLLSVIPATAQIDNGLTSETHSLSAKSVQ